MGSAASFVVLALIEPPSVARVALELARLPLVTRHPSILAYGFPEKLPADALEPLQITDALHTQVLVGGMGLPDDLRKWLAFALLREGGALIVRGVPHADLRAARGALDRLLRPTQPAHHLIRSEGAVALALELDDGYVPGHRERITALAYAPSGHSLATTGDDGTIRIWDTQSGKEVSVLAQLSWSSASLSFAPDGEAVAAAWRGRIGVWNVHKRWDPMILKGDGFVWSPDGKRIAFVDHSGDTPYIGTLETIDGVQRLISTDHSHDVARVVSLVSREAWSIPGEVVLFLDSGDEVVVGDPPLPDGTQSGVVSIWRLGDSNPRLVLQGAHPVLLPDRRSLLTHLDDGTARVWSVVSGEELTRIQIQDKEWWSHPALISPDGDHVVFDTDGAALWSLARQERLGDLKGHQFSFSPDGRRLAAVSGGWLDEEGEVVIYESSTLHELWRLPGNTVAFSPEGEVVAVAARLSGYSYGDPTVSDPSRAELWWVGKRLAVLEGEQPTFSPSGKELVTALDDGRALVWDATTGLRRLILGQVRVLVRDRGGWVGAAPGAGSRWEETREYAEESMRQADEQLRLADRTRAETLREVEPRREESWKEGIEPRPRPARRYLNLAIAGKSRSTVLAEDPLEVEHDYLLRISIGSRDTASIVSTPKPFPTEYLPPDSTDGYWFDVVVVSADVEIVPSVGRLFLPFDGSSWVCACIGPEHTCEEARRDRYLYMPFRTRAAGAATLRCTVYHRDNVVQSALVELLVAVRERTKQSQVAAIDYTLSADFADVGLLEARSLNVLTNESGQGTHKIVLKGSERTVIVDLPKGTADGLLDRGRAELRAVTLDRTGQRSRYRSDNTQDTKSFLQDLKGLANVGAEFLVQVVPKRLDRSFLRDRLRTRSPIQIARVARSTSFPWALIYDLPVELNPDWRLCPLLAGWDLHRQLLAALPDRCPFEDQHAEKNVLCPFGFWGYKHIIEQPPSTAVPRKQIAPAPRAAAPIARSLALNSRLSQAHLTDLETCFARRFTLSDCTTKDALSKLVAEPALPLIYFYCHGKEGEVGASEMPVPYLEIGKDDAIGARDFTTWGDIAKWPQTHWAEVAPLVFINGCHTLKLTPETIVGFADVLADENAAGVIGTEISVAQETANEVAQRFWTYFAGERPVNVGEALYRTRIDLLTKGNVSGLVYTAFCLAELSLVDNAAQDAVANRKEEI